MAKMKLIAAIVFALPATAMAGATDGGTVPVGSEPSSVAVGPGSYANFSAAVGVNAGATGNNSLAVGNAATAGTTDASGAPVLVIAPTYGYSQQTAVGDSAKAWGTGDASFGTMSIAVSQPALGFTSPATAIGYQATVWGNNSTAVGAGAVAGQGAVAGTAPPANITTTNASAFGAGANAGANGATALGANSTATGTGSISINGTATGTNGVAVGTGSFATTGVAVGSGAVSFNGGVAVGTNAVATHANSAAIGPNSQTSAANTVSVGSAGNEKRVTNVADGVSNTDAVNVRQLNTAISGISFGGVSQGEFDQQISRLDSRIDKVEKNANRGTAATAAMIQPVYFAPGKDTAVTVGVGSYGGEAAVGASVNRVVEIEKGNPFMLSAGIAASSGGSAVFRAGMSFSF